MRCDYQINFKGETGKVVSSAVGKRKILLDRDTTDLHRDVFDELDIEMYEECLRRFLKRSTFFLNDSRPNSRQECRIETTFTATAGFKCASR